MDTTQRLTENTEEQAETRRVVEALRRCIKGLKNFNVYELKQIIKNILTSTVDNFVLIAFKIGTESAHSEIIPAKAMKKL